MSTMMVTKKTVPAPCPKKICPVPQEEFQTPSGLSETRGLLQPQTPSMPTGHQGLLQQPLQPAPGKDYLSTLVKKSVTQIVAKPKGIKEPTNEVPQYQDHAEIMNKIIQKAPMDLKDLRQMQSNIKLLDQEAHIELCRMLVNFGDSKVEYMVNGYGTHFDLVDLPSELLWQMYYYINLSLEDVERKKIKEEAHKQFQQNQENNPQFQKMQQFTQNNIQQNIFQQALPTYSTNNVPTYEDLRNDALRNLQQSQLISTGSLLTVENTDTNSADDSENEDDNNTETINEIDDIQNDVGDPSEFADYDD